ncbi:uncharacterized protein ARMOST_05561 [Armillaria ostoyae]|uniref:Uncharacterized protein n=1 Tax=Armillaria ostoyae TaxID=47428 RepID=A0A284R0N8_ARMOS|nr:uncharacterized protein ARMOST_05561 [Armillaria ostoyae]
MSSRSSASTQSPSRAIQFGIDCLSELSRRETPAEFKDSRNNGGRHGRFIWLRSKFSSPSYYLMTAFPRSDHLLGIGRAVLAVRWKVYSRTRTAPFSCSLLSPISTQGAEELDLTVLIRQESCMTNNRLKDIRSTVSQLEHSIV